MTRLMAAAISLSLALGFATLRARAQANVSAESKPAILVTAARMLDVRRGVYIEPAAVLIEGDRVTEAGTPTEVRPHVPNGFIQIDLQQATLLRGLIDCHTHLMARFGHGPDDYLLGLATKSQAYRALERAADARLTLLAGFTTVRDVENDRPARNAASRP